MKKQTKKSAIETMLDWKYNPGEIENKVDKRDFTKQEKKIIQNISKINDEPTKRGIVMNKGLDDLKIVTNLTRLINGELYDELYERYNTIEKELKALEIIKKKKVFVAYLMKCDSADEYNTALFMVEEQYHLTEEEYNMLKEVLL